MFAWIDQVEGTISLLDPFGKFRTADSDSELSRGQKVSSAVDFCVKAMQQAGESRHFP